MRGSIQVSNGRLRKRDRELLYGPVPGDDCRAVAIAVAQIIINADIVL